ncbi:MAG: phage integrase SAM-like domain-containing protein [Candidatus Roizmanbacteria bacterium]|nr:phage integrase SAM-like domain-containing protein [Candidatus Roizmanbacteria bacterium]
MGNRYNFFYFEAEFKKYLTAGKAEASTVKNYLSDLHYFFTWVQNTRHITDFDYSELEEVFCHSLIHSYYEYLEASTNSENTIERRLATLRKFFLLCIDQRWLKTNPADEFDKKTKRDEQEEVITSYKKSLSSQKYTVDELARHINVIRDLVINSQLL